MSMEYRAFRIFNKINSGIRPHRPPSGQSRKWQSAPVNWRVRVCLLACSIVAVGDNGRTQYVRRSTALRGTCARPRERIMLIQLAVGILMVSGASEARGGL